MTRALIETRARQALRDMKDSPERSMRNFVDLGVHFTEGRFKEDLLVTLQELLQNENSAYYKLVTDTIHHTESENLLTFGMNVCYDSCTSGAETIRKIEANEGFDIPWTLFVKINNEEYSLWTPIYEKTVAHGKKLGIHTYLLFSRNNHEQLLPLISENKDCAFVVLCEPKTVTEKLLDDFVGCNNLMLSVAFSEKTDETARACTLLRERKMLYSIHMMYNDDTAQCITEDYPWCDTEAQHAPLTITIPSISCSETVRNAVYNTVYKVRKAQRYATVPWDGYTDNRFIDSVISDCALMAGFDEQGYLHTVEGCKKDDTLNLLKAELKDILRRAFPKRHFGDVIKGELL